MGMPGRIFVRGNLQALGCGGSQGAAIALAERDVPVDGQGLEALGEIGQAVGGGVQLGTVDL